MTADSDDLRTLLSTCRPFDSLSPDDLSIAIDAAELRDHAPGDHILDAFASTPTHIYVVVSGEVDLWYDLDRIGQGPADKFGRGAALGFSAVLSAKPVGPLVTARRRTRVARFPADVVIPAFASRTGAQFLAEHISHARRLATSQPVLTLVSDLVRQEPLVIAPGETVLQTARMMTDLDISYAAVDIGDGRFGIITDENLRRRVLAEGLPTSVSAGDVMIYPAATASLDMSSADALIELVDRDVEFLLVKNLDGTLRGAVGERDFMMAPTTAGVGVNERIRKAHTVDALTEHARRVPLVLAEILERGLAADRVIAVYSAIVDSIIRRALILVFDERDDLTTSAFTWLSLGSNGRREAVLSSDVDAAVTFRDDHADAIPRYREAFGAVGDILVRCGINVDSHHAFPIHKGFSRTESQWRKAAEGWLARPGHNQGTIMTSLLVDARPIFGDPALPSPARAFSDFNRYPVSVGLLLQDSLSRRARLHSVRNRVTGRGDTFDVKSRGLLPIVNIARWASLGTGSTQLQTSHRLRAAAGSDLLPERDADRLIEAFDTLQLIRLEHQLRQSHMGATPDDIVVLDQLSPIDRSTVERTVREIAAIQRRMGRVAHMTPAAELAKRGRASKPGR